jgi:hypothetical protein
MLSVVLSPAFSGVLAYAVDPFEESGVQLDKNDLGSMNEAAEKYSRNNGIQTGSKLRMPHLPDELGFALEKRRQCRRLTRQSRRPSPC